MARADQKHARKERLSLDQGIKELLQLRPIDALAFLLPQLHARRGNPVRWEFLTTQVRKKDLRRKGYVMDLNIRYEFAEGVPVLLVLVEHWSQARSVDLVRSAHYYLDLMERFPGEEIVPVALVTERVAHEIPDTLRGAGDGEEFFRFRTRVVQLAEQDADHWAQTTNLVAVTQLLAMGGMLDRVHKLICAAEAFRENASDDEIKLLFPLFVELGKLDETEEETVMSYLATMPKPRLLVKMEALAAKQGMESGLQQGLEQVLEQGERRKALDAARKLLEHHVSWEIITAATGVGPDDLSEALN
jgi:hypothetical protein